MQREATLKFSLLQKILATEFLEKIFSVNLYLKTELLATNSIKKNFPQLVYFFFFKGFCT
jgi:hypothetical protein